MKQHTYNESPFFEIIEKISNKPEEMNASDLYNIKQIVKITEILRPLFKSENQETIMTSMKLCIPNLPTDSVITDYILASGIFNTTVLTLKELINTSNQII